MTIIKRYDIDGYPLVVKQLAGGAKLVAEGNGLTFDESSAFHLNTLLSIARKGNDGGEAHQKLMKGIFIHDQWGGIFPYPDQSARKVIDFIEQFVKRFGYSPSSEIWVIGSASDDFIFIPFESIRKILELRLEVEGANS